MKTETFAAYKAGREPPTFSVKDIELITLNYTDEHGWQEIPVLLNRVQECVKKVDDGKIGILSDAMD